MQKSRRKGDPARNKHIKSSGTKLEGCSLSRVKTSKRGSNAMAEISDDSDIKGSRTKLDGTRVHVLGVDKSVLGIYVGLFARDYHLFVSDVE